MLRPTLIAIGLALLCAGLATAAGPAAHASKGCDISGKERKLGATYVTSLRVRSLSCSEGQSLVKGYHACRRKNGGAKGKCPHFSGYRCTEKRQAIKTQFDAKAECTRGTKVFSQVYTQNT